MVLLVDNVSSEAGERSIAEQLRGLMREHGYSARELAGKAGVEPSTINRIMVRGSARPSTQAAIAKVFGMTAGELERWTPGNISKVVIEPGSLPLLSTVPAGRGDDLADYDGVGVAEAYVSRTVFGGIEDRSAYCLRVRGDSMTPTLEPGELIACSPDAVADGGFVDEVIYVVRYGSDDEATVKRVFMAGEDRLKLQPDNPRHDPIWVRYEDIHHAARVVGKVTLFDLEGV